MCSIASEGLKTRGTAVVVLQPVPHSHGRMFVALYFIFTKYNKYLRTEEVSVRVA
jgi:hypothetical protein